MAHTQHPGKDKLKKYVRDTLSDELHLEIGEHLFSCKECMKRARGEYKHYILLENWSARNIGELLWRMKLLTELKKRGVSEIFTSDTRQEERINWNVGITA